MAPRGTSNPSIESRGVRGEALKRWNTPQHSRPGFAIRETLSLDSNTAYSVGDLLLQRLDALEQEAEEKGGVQQALADHFAKVYKVSMPLAA
jgi:hypothetical protein